ncbi:MAG: cystathionine beta-lyase [Geminicoccaceae bacterium]
MRDETKLIVGGRPENDSPHLVNVGVHRGSTVLFPTMEALKGSHPDKGLAYGRYGTETTKALEQTIAELEQAAGAVIFSSGKAAITLTLLSLLEAGDHILVTDSVYQPTRNFCDRILSRFGVTTTYFDPTTGTGIEALMTERTRLIFTESPGSQTFEVQDIPAIASVAKAKGALVLCDNTWATPLFFKPYDHGVDITIHAATKYIVGHSDAMMGIVTYSEALAKRLRADLRELGAGASPDDCFLALRGLRSMAVRLRQHERSALEMARWLGERPEVERVMHPALPHDPGHAIWKRDFSGSSGLFGLVLKPCSEEALAAMLDGLALFGMGYSWGGFESLLIPTKPVRTATSWEPAGPSLRMHVGLEEVEDLKVDLTKGFARLADVERRRAGQGLVA